MYCYCRLHFALLSIIAMAVLSSLSFGFTVVAPLTLKHHPAQAATSMFTTLRREDGTTRTASFVLLSSKEGSETSSSSSAFVPLDNAPVSENDTNDDDDDLLEKVELFGKGAAKAKRGKRKGESSSSTSSKQAVKASMAPEIVFYEGPPAITETLAPTLSIVTVVGIIPAAAAWARQAWVRYKITNRRIRVTSGLNGQDMAEIVYSDIVELRTVRRLFGEGDMVAFLRDGAKFEMRNIPNFIETMEFILGLVDADVATMYREKGDVGKG